MELALPIVVVDSFAGRTKKAVGWLHYGEAVVGMQAVMSVASSYWKKRALVR